MLLQTPQHSPIAWTVNIWLWFRGFWRTFLQGEVLLMTNKRARTSTSCLQDEVMKWIPTSHHLSPPLQDPLPPLPVSRGQGDGHTKTRRKARKAPLAGTASPRKRPGFGSDLGSSVNPYVFPPTFPSTEQKPMKCMYIFILFIHILFNYMYINLFWNYIPRNKVCTNVGK